MADLDYITKSKLESIFQMGGGYVLDFTNDGFSDFIKTAAGFDPYTKYGSQSKAKLLRKIWNEEPMPVVAKIVLNLLDYWSFLNTTGGGKPSEAEFELHNELKEHFSSMFSTAADTASLEFLKKDFSDLDLAALPSELTAQQVVQARLDEIDRSLKADAPLGVIFLAGSTLEGLLFELATKHPQMYTSSPRAPRYQGRVKSLDAWTLSDLITVSHELGVLGEDVARFADHLRNFRNYIHPRQQLKEQFEPRIETAEIAYKVLKAALTDLQQLSDPGRALAGG